MVGQWSTTAKRQRHWPECGLHSLTSEVWKHSMSPDIRLNSRRFTDELRRHVHRDTRPTASTSTSQIKQVRAGHLTVQSD